MALVILPYQNNENITLKIFCNFIHNQNAWQNYTSVHFLRTLRIYYLPRITSFHDVMIAICKEKKSEIYIACGHLYFFCFFKNNSKGRIQFLLASLKKRHTTFWSDFVRSVISSCTQWYPAARRTGKPRQAEHLNFKLQFIVMCEAL